MPPGRLRDPYLVQLVLGLSSYRNRPSEAVDMRAPHDRARLLGRLGLTQQVALLSLVPMIVLGFILARVLQAQIVSRTLADASAWANSRVVDGDVADAVPVARRPAHGSDAG